MIHEHEHHRCACGHQRLTYCQACRLVYCMDCRQEWVTRSVWYPYYQPYLSGGISTLRAQSDSSLQPLGSQTNQYAVTTSCTHGDALE